MDEPAARLSSGTPPEVTVRYWAAARAAAGVAEEKIAAATLAEALTQLHAAHSGGERFARVLGVCSFLVGDQPVGTRDAASVALSAGDVVEVLPPFAGG
jgi:sulfur-carrier protein